MASAKSTRQEPTPIPAILSGLLVEKQPDWLSPNWVRLLESSYNQALQIACEELTERHGQVFEALQSDGI